MQDVHDCPALRNRNMDQKIIEAEPNPVPTVPEYPPTDAVEIMRAWFAERGAEFNPEEFSMGKPE